ncbi:MAG: hypothetical protein U1F66_04845 [bacterium]
MGLGDLFKRLSKGSSERDKPAAPSPRLKGGKAMPPLPAYLKKDKFVRPQAAGPEAEPGPESGPDMAEAGAFKRPGKWLKARLGGVTDSQAIDNIQKTKEALKKSGGMNDQEIQSFLDGLLDPGETAQPEGAPLPRPPKSP